MSILAPWRASICVVCSSGSVPSNLGLYAATGGASSTLTYVYGALFLAKKVHDGFYSILEPYPYEAFANFDFSFCPWISSFVYSFF